MRVFSNKGRPVPLGALPLERIRRVGSAPDLEHARHATHGPSPADGNLLAGICANYGRVLPMRSPIERTISKG